MPSVPTAYAEVKITNHTSLNASALYLFVQSQTQIYQLTNVRTTQSPFWLASSVTSPSTGNAPSVTLNQLPANPDGSLSFYLDSTDQLTSGRIYFSDSAAAVQIGSGGSINGPSPTASFNFDFVELTLNAGATINLDTSQVDQFGMPIRVETTPVDPNFTQGTGIVPTTSRGTVIENFSDLTAQTAFSAYGDCIDRIPAAAGGHAVARIIAPQHVIGNQCPQTKLAGTLSSAAKDADKWTATFTATGTWDTTWNTPPTSLDLTAGWQVSGAGLPANSVIASLSGTTVQLSSNTGAFTDHTNVDLAFYPAPATALATLFDDALHRLFKYYHTHTLYLVANGAGSGTGSGMEIYAGEVITDYQLPAGITDINGGTGTSYTVFKFTGTGYTYNQANNTLSATTAPGAGKTNVYHVFYPYFSTNYAHSPNNNELTPGGPPPPPAWWAPGWNAGLGNLNFISPASQMVFACDGVFGDSAYQQAAFQAITGQELQDVTILGNLENQLVTLLNRGIAPDTGSTNGNLHLRTGYVTANDFNPTDPSVRHSYADPAPAGPSSTLGASTTYTLTAPPPNNAILEDTISGDLYIGSAKVQSFTVSAGGTFTFNPATVSSGPYATGGQVSLGTSPSITIDWSVPPDATSAKFAYDYSPRLGDHYATLHLVNPYGQHKYTFVSGDLGPSSNLSGGLTPGMQMTTTANFSQPMELHAVKDESTVIIYSPLVFNTTQGAFNTGILTFGDFYPLNNEPPTGTWNGYAYYFHNGNLGEQVPTIDGRGYAFPFDDNGGYSSDIDIALKTTNPTATVAIDLLSWGFSVSATRSWQLTGVTVSSAKTTTVTYQSGLWTANPKDNGGNLYGAGGNPTPIEAKPGYAMPESNEGALVGKVGETVFLIGTSATVPSGLEGPLELCINDDLHKRYGAGLTDNEGEITVEITTT